jgi:hypothetical protein
MAKQDQFADRKRLTFEEAEGAAALPAQLKLKAVTPLMRALLWEKIYAHLKEATDEHDDYPTLDPAWEKIFYNVHILRDHGMADEFENDAHALTDQVKDIIQKGDYLKIFGWIQFVLRQRPPETFAGAIDGALKGSHAAYRVVDKDTIVPITADADRVTVARAFEDLEANEFHGARKHLQLAAENLTSGKISDSIRESIHAVESVVRVLEPKGDFSKALAKLETKTKIHGALKQGFISIYGFTSDEKGIRHPLLDKSDANVDEADALFMIGACSSFITYLLNKARAGKLL